jgi:hypothetical protein
VPRNAIPTTTPVDTGVVYWPEPSPLDGWWTEIMDGVTPIRARSTVTGEHTHPRPTPPPYRGCA